MKTFDLNALGLKYLIVYVFFLTMVFSCDQPSNTKDTPSISIKKDSSNVVLAEHEVDSALREKLIVPINDLFDAWRNLDIDKYLHSWHESAIQKSKGKIIRSFSDLKIDRPPFFKKLASVSIEKFEIEKVEKEGLNQFKIDVSYSMIFLFKDGKVIRESNVKENYTVSKFADKYLIVENNDYL